MQSLSSPLSGTFTALVTPFNRDGTVDTGALDALVAQQLAAKIDGLVPCGTTGEAATLTADERDLVLSRVVQAVAGRIPVVAGTGSNSTAATILAQRRALDLGASHGLVVTPYYNRPTAEGLYAHYAAVAEATPLPLLAYNVPSRTGCDLTAAVWQRLASSPRIVGFKEASGDLTRLPALRAASADAALLSGDDLTCAAFVLLGGDGVISVLSNLLPAAMVALVAAARAGALVPVRAAQARLAGLMADLFRTPNPVPIKAALALRGDIQEIYRLPLVPLPAAERAALADRLHTNGWL